ncbi:MAG: GAF domain-containing protein, partial [Acidobacteria bacterium]|nr:GAF domain-containing protein [Acidobacteriota bacterium]
FLLILAAGLAGGFVTERMGGRRALIPLAGALILLGAASLLLSRFLQIEILYIPLTLSALLGAAAAQARRLWIIDTALARNVRQLAAEASQLEGNAASARLQSGLKLLATVLPLEEAVVFRLDETGRALPAARRRGIEAAPKANSAEADRNSAWREGVRLTERAVASADLVTATLPGSAQESSSVALPLRHEGRTVGALLVRLRESFDERDRPLLAAVGAQLARDLQRDEARAAEEQTKFSTPLFSAEAARRRLESFGVVSGLLTEQSFAAHVLAEASDGHAVAYLDGTVAYVNPPLLKAAQLTEEEARSLDLFALLDRFRGGVFDEPSIAVRRVLQTGDPYERELRFADRNLTLELRIALITNSQRETDDAPQPLCL